MKLSVSTKEESGYLFSEAAGEWDLEGLKGFADGVVAEARNRGYDRVLVDASRISRAPQEYGRFRLGEHVASVLVGIKAAVLTRGGEQGDKLFENTAVNRGAWISIFTDKQTALKWLNGSECRMFQSSPAQFTAELKWR
jgi:hypothetical protein